MQSCEANQQLFEAIEAGDIDNLNRTLAAGADPNATNQEGLRALHIAMEQDDALALMRALIDGGADVEATDGEAQSPLVYAVHYRDDEALRLLLKAGADPFIRDDIDAYGTSPYQKALELFDHRHAEAGEPEYRLLGAFYDSGIDPNQPYEDGYLTPLVFACYESHRGLIEYLLNRGAGLNHRCDVSEYGGQVALTALFEDPTDLARTRELVGWFIEMGVDVNARRGDGMSALMFAVELKDLDMAQMLLEAGADACAYRGKGEQRLCVYEMAAMTRQPDMLRLLEHHGATDPTPDRALQQHVMWRQIFGVLGAGFDEFLPTLGVSMTRIAQLEQILGQPLPTALRSHLLLWGDQGGVCFGEHIALGVDQIERYWRLFTFIADQGGDLVPAPAEDQERLPAIGMAWWRRGWIPFARNESDELLCIDMHPVYAGHAGQVIAWRPLSGPVRVHARSFDALLSKVHRFCMRAVVRH